MDQASLQTAFTLARAVASLGLDVDPCLSGGQVHLLARLALFADDQQHFTRAAHNVTAAELVILRAQLAEARDTIKTLTAALDIPHPGDIV